MSKFFFWEIGLASMLLTALFTWFLIPALKRAKAGQHIREEGPESHLSKAGTPSMGGIAIIGAILLVMLTSGAMSERAIPPLLGLLLFGAIGFLDDYAKVVKKHNLGLRAWQKFSLQCILAIVYACYMAWSPQGGTGVYIPFYGKEIDFGLWYIPFIVFTILAMVNAINLTDGLDGLASGVTAQVSFFFAILAVGMGGLSEGLIFAALTGACLGFLIFNRHPAKIFMGDTGSLALGGGVALAAIAMKMELFLLLAGLIYVLEAFSVVLQVAVFKCAHGKRLFRMAPLHHHFEQKGMKETQVVALFWLGTLLFCLMGMAIFWMA